ncbi:MAG: tetratricopeptide repeat protein [Gemmatimonadetes bacterium]|nr:tetratricopeptide repeat protein [Gemmatimonadota bacterium]MBT6147695.1 tetratricopeptide repeat protein [Gemmatimonadota bacterium]MBT7862625.1 tetratricopeptide repeat protein [Gemmatimonadota bacterium]
MISIASDVQGSTASTPWLDEAKVTFTRLTDQTNEVGKAFALKYVPVGVLLDAQGRLVRPVGLVNIDNEDFRSELESWVTSGEIPAAWTELDAGATPVMTPDEREADARLQLALVLLERGKREEAIQQLQQAVVCDPENWLIRKQMWAIQMPSAFYDGPVDYDWQKQQQEEEASGLLAGS